MLRKIMISFVVIFSISQTNATEKNKIDLDRTFWGTWELINTKFACTEQYEFKKPGNVVYQANKKKLAGEFAVIRHNDPKTLDTLILDIKSDNGLIGCGSDTNNYQGKQSVLSLKWISDKSAELCADNIGKQCTGLYLNKK